MKKPYPLATLLQFYKFTIRTKGYSPCRYYDGMRIETHFSGTFILEQFLLPACIFAGILTAFKHSILAIVLLSTVALVEHLLKTPKGLNFLNNKLPKDVFVPPRLHIDIVPKQGIVAVYTAEDTLRPMSGNEYNYFEKKLKPLPPSVQKLESYTFECLDTGNQELVYPEETKATLFGKIDCVHVKHKLCFENIISTGMAGLTERITDLDTQQAKGLLLVAIKEYNARR